MRRGLYRHSRFQGPFRGPNLLIDGDMEAVGVGAWTVTNGTLSKQTTAPYEGLRYMQVAKTGAPNAYYYQGVVTVAGKRYRLTGRAGSVSGVSYPRVYQGSFIWDGTISTEWRPIDISWIAVPGNLYFYATLGGAGNGTKWDDLYLSLES